MFRYLVYIVLLAGVMFSVVSCHSTGSKVITKRDSCIVFDRIQEVTIGTQTKPNIEKVTANVYRLACKLKDGRVQVPVVPIEVWAVSTPGKSIILTYDDRMSEEGQNHQTFFVLAWFLSILLVLYASYIDPGDQYEKHPE